MNAASAVFPVTAAAMAAPSTCPVSSGAITLTRQPSFSSADTAFCTAGCS